MSLHDSMSRPPGVARRRLVIGAGLVLLLVQTPACRKSGDSDASGQGSCRKLTALSAPKLPASLALDPAAGHSLLLRLRASGVQAYVCRQEEGSDGAWSWQSEGPKAELLDDDCAAYGKLTKGPTWRASGTEERGGWVSGSAVAEAPSPDSASLPWRRLWPTNANGKSPFGRSEIILEVDTAGGKPPSDACDGSRADARVEVPFQATYYFFGRSK